MMNTDRKRQKHLSVALLFHLANWNSSQVMWPIADNIHLANIKGSKIERLYHYLCSEFGEDDGDPYIYGAYAIIHPTEETTYLLDYGDPYSTIDRFCNMLVILAQAPMFHTKVIASLDDFQTSSYTHTIHYEGAQSSFLYEGKLGITFNDKYIHEACDSWRTIEKAWANGKAQGRLNNILTFFNYAWRSHYMDQICLNLAVCIEGLFAPHSQSETTHQLCFNFSRYLGRTSEDRERIYDDMRKFYAMRSAVVHGDIPNDEQIIDRVIQAFRYTTEVLRRILLDSEQAEAFSLEKDRKKMFRGFLFG
jgi:hypothetical protein